MCLAPRKGRDRVPPALRRGAPSSSAHRVHAPDRPSDHGVDGLARLGRAGAALATPRHGREQRRRRGAHGIHCAKRCPQARALAGARGGAAPRRGGGVGGRRRALAADAVGDPQPLAAAAAAARGAQERHRQPDAVHAGAGRVLGEHGGDDGGDLQVPAHHLGDRLDRRRPRPGDPHLPDGAGGAARQRVDRAVLHLQQPALLPRALVALGGGVPGALAVEDALHRRHDVLRRRQEAHAQAGGRRRRAILRRAIRWRAILGRRAIL